MAADRVEYSLRVDGLASSCEQHHLEKHFGVFGEVTDIYLLRDRDYGFVRFSDEAAAQAAQEELDGVHICGRAVRVTHAHNPKRRASPDPKRSKSATFAFKCLASEHVVSALIGKGGAALQQLQDETGAHLEFSPRGTYFPDTRCRTITIRAHEAYAIEQVLQDIVGLIHEQGKLHNDEWCLGRTEGDLRFIALMARHATGSLLGRGGEDIRRLQSDLRCFIEVEKTPPRVADHQRVEIRGTEDEVFGALKVVNEKVQGESHREWFPGWMATDPVRGGASSRRDDAARPASPPRKRLNTRESDPDAPAMEELEGFRRKHPMDDTAWDYLLQLGGPIQRKVLLDFRPKPLRSDDIDYSAMVTSFATSVARRYNDNPEGFRKGVERRDHNAQPRRGPAVSREKARREFDDTFNEFPTEYLEADYAISCYLPADRCKAIKDCVADVSELTRTQITIEPATDHDQMNFVAITGAIPDVYNAHMRLMWSFKDGEESSKHLQRMQEQIAELQAQLKAAKSSAGRGENSGGRTRNGRPVGASSTG